MGTTAEKLQNIVNVKTALSGIIADKGETVPARFAEYPAALAGLSGGIDLSPFTPAGYAGDIVSDVGALAPYALRGLACSGDLVLDSLTSAGEYALSYLSCRDLHIECLEEQGGANMCAYADCRTVYANRLVRRATSFTAAGYCFAGCAATTIYCGWDTVNTEVTMAMSNGTAAAMNRLFYSCRSLQTVYLGRITGAQGIGSGSNTWSGDTALRAVYCGSSDPDTLLTLVSGGWGFPAGVRPPIYCWCMELGTWYEFAWTGSAYAYAEVVDTSGLPPIPGASR